VRSPDWADAPGAAQAFIELSRARRRLILPGADDQPVGLTSARGRNCAVSCISLVRQDREAVSAGKASETRFLRNRVSGERGGVRPR